MVPRSMTLKPRVVFVALALPSILFWAGCGAGTPGAGSTLGPDDDWFLELKPGMSRAEVVHLLGEPTHKGDAASATMRAVMSRLVEFEGRLAPAFVASESAPDEAPIDADDPLEGDHWLYGPHQNLQVGDNLIALSFTNAKLDSALRLKVVRPPMR